MRWCSCFFQHRNGVCDVHAGARNHRQRHSVSLLVLCFWDRNNWNMKVHSLDHLEIWRLGNIHAGTFFFVSSLILLLKADSCTLLQDSHESSWCMCKFITISNLWMFAWHERSLVCCPTCLDCSSSAGRTSSVEGRGFDIHCQGTNIYSSQTGTTQDIYSGLLQ